MDVDKHRQTLSFEHGRRGYEARDIQIQPTILVCECRINQQPTFCVCCQCQRKRTCTGIPGLKYQIRGTKDYDHFFPWSILRLKWSGLQWSGHMIIKYVHYFGSVHFSYPSFDKDPFQDFCCLDAINRLWCLRKSCCDVFTSHCSPPKRKEVCHDLVCGFSISIRVCIRIWHQPSG